MTVLEQHEEGGGGHRLCWRAHTAVVEGTLAVVEGTGCGGGHTVIDWRRAHCSAKGTCGGGHLAVVEGIGCGGGRTRLWWRAHWLWWRAPAVVEGTRLWWRADVQLWWSWRRAHWWREGTGCGGGHTAVVEGFVVEDRGCGGGHSGSGGGALSGR